MMISGPDRPFSFKKLGVRPEDEGVLAAHTCCIDYLFDTARAVEEIRSRLDHVRPMWTVFLDARAS